MPLNDKTHKPYNPFIHGTNSSFFAIFAKNGFAAKSPIKLIRDNQAVPITGELTQGGYDHAGFDSIDNEGVGKVSLGMLTKECFYDLDKILSNYTNIPVTTPEKTRQALESAVYSARGLAYSNIHLILIYLARAKQFGMDIDTIIDPSTQDKLLAELEATVQFYYFLQLFGIHIFPTYPNEMMSQERRQYKQALRTHLTFDHILSQIIDKQLDMRAILANPSRENIEKVLKLLELPKSIQLKRFEYGDEEKSFSADLYQLFGTERTDKDYDDLERLQPDYFFNYLTRNNLGRHDYKINDALAKYGLIGSETYSHEFMQHMGGRARDYLIGFEERIALLKKTLSEPNESFALLEADKIFSDPDKAFPVILIVSPEADVKPYQHEYRAEGELKLGRDIVGIAVKDEADRALMRDYLERNGYADRVELVLFDDLKRSAKNGLSPSENAAVAREAEKPADARAADVDTCPENTARAAHKVQPGKRSKLTRGKSNQHRLFKPVASANHTGEKHSPKSTKSKNRRTDEQQALGFESCAP